MFDTLRATFWELMSRGGVVMWPLLLLSLVSLTLIVERAWFWVRLNSPGQLARLARISRQLRQNDTSSVRVLVEGDRGVYGAVVKLFIGEPMSEAVVTDAIESQRPSLERFMPALSTVISAAPMLGILGTVLGIIASFQALSDQATAHDPRIVGQGIAEALITTAVGLVIAIVVLFPYNAFRAQIDRSMGRIEMLAAAAMRGNRSTDRSAGDPGDSSGKEKPAEQTPDQSINSRRE